MSLATDFNKNCPLFDWEFAGGGVLFPFVMRSTLPYIDLDGGVTSGAPAHILQAPCKMRLVTCYAYAVADATGLKAAAASTEPVITVRHNSSTAGSIEAGSIVALITCDGAGAYGNIWTPGAGTTQVTLEAGDTLWAYLSTAAVSATSANVDGGAAIVLWLASVNAP